ncbi:hypothetical protein [Priestia taiwanensis]|uniref:Uncharacterized protein n=1 Tax=Priestia taiwanensis TaxID=1347902 RepID=A0A917AWZ1_9BACI|nr:hypothetical protein [Priestia taiwanensis]MBM7364898.1 hypothetical protein [Priestia taiwanensis]GGE82774.1 hypothetical protein GCM10007140_35430 [Priestia taiwanensis]
MLTFEEKLTIIESFPELTRNNVSLGRVNFHYEESSFDKKNVVYHLHPNGNGFVYGEFLQGYDMNDKGMVNIRDFSAEELRNIVEKSIHSLAPRTVAEEAIIGDNKDETWMSGEGHLLTLVHEDDMWNVYAGINLDGCFNSYGEAANYLEEEGFRRV